MKKPFTSRLIETRKEFNEATIIKDPFIQFESWFSEAAGIDPDWHNAMTLSTSTPSGRPSSRVVLLKEFNSKGFIFFSNYLSRKGREIESNPFGSLVFFWAVQERQIRIEGKIEKTSSEISDVYFRSRPIDSRIAAIASNQSEIIPGRHTLESRFDEISAKYKGKEIPRPVHWGGYILIPDIFEFWQGRINRMHDRFRYSRVNSGWDIGRLSP